MDLEGLQSLSAYLSHWESKTIIVYYRRYYDWIQSFYNQHVKARKFDEECFQGHNFRKWEFTFHDYLDRDFVRKVPKVYTGFLVSKLRKQFGDDDSVNLVIMDFHDRRVDLAEGFFCKAFPNARHTCDAIRDKPKHPKRQNPSVFLLLV